MTTSGSAEQLFDAYARAWSTQDVDAVAAFFTEDGVYEDVPMGALNRGTAEITSFLTRTFAAFPDFTVEPQTAFVAGTWAGGEWTMSGTHAGGIPGLPATGKRFAVRGASIIELEDGKIRRCSTYWDMATFLQQVGVLPAPPQSGG